MNGRVLLVDDNKNIRSILKSGLEQFGYEVEEACDGIDGLKKAKSDNYCAIVTDDKMNLCDGWHMVKDLHEIPQCSNIPVVMLTTCSAEEAKSAVKRLHIEQWLQKPVKAEAVAKALECVKHMEMNALAGVA